MISNVKMVISLLLLATCPLALSSCVVVNPQSTPEPSQTLDPGAASVQSPPQESTQPQVAPNENETYPSGVTETPQLELLVSDQFTLGESITDEERSSMFPDIDEQDENGTLSYPNLLYDMYYGESFFLTEGEVAHLELWTNGPVGFWEDDTSQNDVVLASMGPSMEYREEWRYEGHEEIDWTDIQDFTTRRSSGGWTTEIVLLSPLTGHYCASLLNLTKNPVECDLEISVEVN